jgi:sn1-specific diacylglycerol lipase
MIDAAAYVHRKLREEDLLNRAFNLSRETKNFDLVCVGHSLGAGAAAILAIMLKQEYPTTRGFSYSPPGGTLR